MSSKRRSPPHDARPAAARRRGHGKLPGLLKRIFQRTLESLWATGFWLVGRLRLQRVEIWSSPGGQRVLVVAPHPDDEVAGCGGVILGHRRSGDQVRILCVTDGRRSSAHGLPPEQMATRRRREMQAAAAALEAELEWLGLPEGEESPGQMSKRLGEALARFQPDLTYAPSRVDFHPEHQAVARALADVMEALPGAAGPTIRIYPIQVPLTASLCNLVAPVDSGAPELLAAMAAHGSQLGSLECCQRQRRYTGRFYGLAGGGEGFWQLAAEQYVRLHREPPARAPAASFRGLRYYALSDPLAYLRGRSERRRLAGRVEPADPAT